jgi:hypothetical protein
MNVNDYLIDRSGKDWSELLSGWLAALPFSFTVWLVNRLGDVSPYSRTDPFTCLTSERV